MDATQTNDSDSSPTTSTSTPSNTTPTPSSADTAPTPPNTDDATTNTTNVDLRVMLPFAGHRVLTTPTTTTVSDLLETLMQPIASTERLTTPHCIVFSGRILPDDATLADEGVTESGAVLHLMPRPSEPQQQQQQRRQRQQLQQQQARMHIRVYPEPAEPIPPGVVIPASHSAIFRVHRETHHHPHPHNHPHHHHHAHHPDHDHDHHHDHHHNHHHDHHHNHHHGHHHAHHHDHHHAHAGVHSMGTNDNNGGGGNENSRDAPNSAPTPSEQQSPHVLPTDGGTPIQANVIVGQIAMDSLSFQTARSVLENVLQAVGYSRHAVSTASTVAAAVAVSNHAPRVPLSAARILRRQAWNAVAAAMPSSSAEAVMPEFGNGEDDEGEEANDEDVDVDVIGEGLVNSGAEGEGEEEEGVTDGGNSDRGERTRILNSRSLTSLLPSLGHALRNAAELVERSQTAEAFVELGGSRGSSGGGGNGDTDGEEVGDNAESRALATVSALATLSNALTTTIAVASTLLPYHPNAEGDEREPQNVGDRDTGVNVSGNDGELADASDGNGASGGGGDEPVADRDGGAERSRNGIDSRVEIVHSGPHGHVEVFEVERTVAAAADMAAAAVSQVAARQGRRDGASGEGGNRTQGENGEEMHGISNSNGVSRQSGEGGDLDASAERMFEPMRDFARDVMNAMGVEVDNVDDRRGRRPRTGPMPVRMRNADFLVRMVSYYLGSFVGGVDGARLVGPEEEVGQTGVSVLHELYGEGPCQVPGNVGLRIVYRVMANMTPREVHAVLNGTFTAVGRIRGRIWNIIVEEQQGRHRDENESMDDISIIEQFVDAVYESMHEFVHAMEGTVQEGVQEDAEVGEEFCHVIMDTVHSASMHFAKLMTSDTSSDEQFGRKMGRWLTESAVSTSSMMAAEMNVDWDGLMVLIRATLGNLSEWLAGARFKVLLPFIGNLVARRVTEVRSLFEAVANTTGDSAPGVPLSDHHTDSSRSASSSSAPIAERASPRVTHLRGHARGRGRVSTADRELPSSERGQDPDRQVGAVPTMDKDDIMLDDDELDVLAAELDAEVKGSDSGKASSKLSTSNDAGPSLQQLDELAHELLQEDRQQSGRNTSDGGGGERTTRVAPSVRLPGVGTASTSLGVGLTAGTLANGGGVRGVLSNAGTATVSSSAVPVHQRTAGGGGSSLAGPSTRRRRGDEFDSALNANEAAKWRQIVEGDVAAMAADMSERGALSRAYRFDRSSVPPLDEERAAAMAVESARAAAEAARLPPEVEEELVRVAGQSGADYMREVERSIASRLSSDSDFDSERFSEASSRFLSSR